LSAGKIGHAPDLAGGGLGSPEGLGGAVGEPATGESDAADVPPPGSDDGGTCAGAEHPATNITKVLSDRRRLPILDAGTDAFSPLVAAGAAVRPPRSR